MTKSTAAMARIKMIKTILNGFVLGPESTLLGFFGIFTIVLHPCE